MFVGYLMLTLLIISEVLVFVAASSSWAVPATGNPAAGEKKLPITIDLSCQPCLSPERFRRIMIEATERNSACKDFLVDLSSCELGSNERISDLLSMISSLPSVHKDSSFGLRLRMNRLSTTDGSSIFERLLSETWKDRSLNSLDLSWNNFPHDEPGSKAFQSQLKKLVEMNCPKEIHLSRCSLGPAACRGIGKGVMNRFSTNNTATPFSLYLCGNPLGDAGAAALAAAIRKSKSGITVFSTLDLTACSIGDAGAEALALALESNPGSIQQLVLSGNKISNAGATSIAHALTDSESQIELLVLDYNSGIGNSGASSLAAAMSKGSIRVLCLRSCDVKADGAFPFGECLKTLSARNETSQVEIDLSGNPLGILRKKKKESIRSKATTTTATYMNFIGKQVKSGLKDVGLDIVLGSSLESDDEEEALMYNNNPSNNNVESTDEPARCGAKALASAILKSEDDSNATVAKSSKRCTATLGMRNCFLDQGAGDALAASVLQLKRAGLDLTVDVTLNGVLEEHMVKALAHADEHMLEDFADRHLEIMEAIRLAEDRAARASAAAARRTYNDDFLHDVENNNFFEGFDVEDADDV